MYFIILPLCSTQQAIALTTENPENCAIAEYLYSIYRQSKKGYWVLWGDRVHHNGQDKAISINTEDLHVGQSVGLLVTRDGDVHLFVDGKHREMVWSGLPTDQPLWGAADVCANCTKIKADILCGKWWNNQHPVFSPFHILLNSVIHVTWPHSQTTSH